VTVHAIGEDGKLGAEPLQSVPTAKMAHAVAPDTSNRWVFVPHTGPNAIFQFAFDPEKGRLMANPTAAKVTTPENTGPRHLAWHPTLPVAYVENEQGSGVTAWSFDARTGTLAPGPTASSLPADFKGVNSGAEVKAHPSGKFLYSSNRGHDSIAVYRLDEKGKPDTAGQEPTEKTPRSFDLDPSGSFLYAAGEGSGKLACYRIDRETGRLKRFATEDVGAKAWWVMAVELPGE
jgi:6-phosphogluconolactonase